MHGAETEGEPIKGTDQSEINLLWRCVWEYLLFPGGWMLQQHGVPARALGTKPLMETADENVRVSLAIGCISYVQYELSYLMHMFES